MADFNSDFWHWYITILTIISILACVWLLRWMTSGFQQSDEAARVPFDDDEPGNHSKPPAE